ncbi:MAG: H-NS histone family protein [Burkholderiales bacterium]|nr:H-NS histone family protein [Burkholderiales bacterium]
MSTYLELKAQGEELLRQAEEARKKEIADVIADIKAKMAQYGINPKDLGHSAPAARKTTKSAPKYRGPNGEFWTGVGPKPRWLKDALAAGKSREDFAI